MKSTEEYELGETGLTVGTRHRERDGSGGRRLKPPTVAAQAQRGGADAKVRTWLTKGQLGGQLGALARAPLRSVAGPFCVSSVCVPVPLSTNSCRCVCAVAVSVTTEHVSAASVPVPCACIPLVALPCA